MLSLWPKSLWPVLIIPTTSLAWEPGVQTPVPTRGFVVDANDRNDVVSFYQAVYKASEGYEKRIAWTGNYTSVAAGAEGTTSAVFAGDVERRLNFFRALAGVPANVRVNTGAKVNIEPADPHKPAATTTKMAAAQRSALMIVRTLPKFEGLSHNPKSADCVAWTTAAWNANNHGNLAMGFFGPGAIDAYMKEAVSGVSAWNVDVGHRRWLLAQSSTDFATGDTPGSYNASNNTLRPPTNVTYVVPNESELNFSQPPVFATYPVAGYLPASLNSPYWSISHPNANFSSATVTMTNAGNVPVTTTVVSRNANFGDRSLVWQVPSSVAVTSVGADVRWNVTISNIQGTGVPSSYSYAVTLIDPEKLPFAPSITGTASPVSAGATYQIEGAPGVERLEAGFFLRKTADWKEGAEDIPAPKVIERTSGTYPFRASNAGYVKTGSKAFRLTFPTLYDPFINGVPEQSFELDRDLLPSSGGKLNFAYRRGLMTAASKLAVEYTADGGVTWTGLTTPYSGTGNGAGDSAYQSASLTLPSTGQPIRVRFRYYVGTGQAIYDHQTYPSQPTGVFIDDIAVTSSDWLEPSGGAEGHDLTSFEFNSASAGQPLLEGQEWWLRPHVILGGKSFPYAAAKVVTITPSLLLTGPGAPPVTGTAYSFIPDPTADSYVFEVSRIAPSSWTEGAETSPPPQVIAGNEATYALYSSTTGYRKSGALAFRLALSNATDTEDMFTLTRETVPSAGSNLEFWTRRGSMSTTNRLHAEISLDEGETWTSIWSIPGLGSAEGNVVKQTVSLAPWANRPLRVRFAIRKAQGGSTSAWNANTSGVWIDDITVTSSSAQIAAKETAAPGSSSAVVLNEVTAGQPLQAGATMLMRLRSVDGSDLGAWGPSLVVSPSLSPDPSLPPSFGVWAAMSYPGLEVTFDGDLDKNGVADGIQYAFGMDPDGTMISDALAMSVSKLEISRPLEEPRTDISYGAVWSDDLVNWSAEGVQIRFENGRIIASVAKGEGGRYMRWVVEPQ